MFSKAGFAVLAGAALAAGQTPNINVDFPNDTPVVMLSMNQDGSRVSPRGAAFLAEVHASLVLRNASAKRIRGVMLTVLTQEGAAGGRASVSVPSLDVAPGDAFTIKMEPTLISQLRPGDRAPSVSVQLDGVLFEDLSFFGPDKLHSQRTLTVWEEQARRDRKFLKGVLETAGVEGLNKEMLRQADMPQAGVQVRGRVSNVSSWNDMQFAMLHLPDAPVDLTGGSARISGNEAGAPHFEVRNTSRRAVRYMEIGWIVKDQDGREFLAASLPSDLNLAPGQSSQVMQDTALRFPGGVPIQGIKAFVSSIGFGDGSYWIPSRKSLDGPELRDVVGPSPEQQRLAQIYHKKGLNALIEELKKF